MLFTILLVISILLLVCVLVINKKENFTNNTNDKPKLWVYLNTKYNSRNWESFYSQSNDSHIPDYLKLCLETIKTNCEDDFDIKLISLKNAKKYLPNLKLDEKNNEEFNKDLLAACLLNKYGGVWMPASTIVLGNVNNLYRKVVDDKLHFGGFSCDSDEYRCNLGSSFKLNQSVYMAPKNSSVAKELAHNLKELQKSHNSDYSFLKTGQDILSKILKKWKGLVKIFPAEVNGTRDCVMKNITEDNLLSNNTTNLLNHEKTMLVTFPREKIEENTKYNWFTRASKEQILLSNLWFSHLISAGLEHKDIKSWTTKQNTKDNYRWEERETVLIGKSPTRNS